MKITLKSELPAIVCFAAMAAMLALAWPSAPERIPVHWNLRGDIDRYGTRFEGLALVPIIGVAIYLIFRFLPLADPRRANYARFATAYDVTRHGALVLMAVIQGLTIAIVRGADVDMALAISSLVGVFFVVVGALMPTLRPNWFFGIRTPWTLSSDLAWTRAHRVAGRVFVAAGLAIAAAGWIRTAASLVVVVAILVVGLLGATWVSYVTWRDDPSRESPDAAARR
ncbi:MAG TPA: SdpI family protein [Candidatus Eisenbacteria bacterium]|nr:SdpI family protein [Candidatus Eisenbacteria bacterium]